MQRFERAVQHVLQQQQQPQAQQQQQQQPLLSHPHLPQQGLPQAAAALQAAPGLSPFPRAAAEVSGAAMAGLPFPRRCGSPDTTEFTSGGSSSSSMKRKRLPSPTRVASTTLDGSGQVSCCGHLVLCLHIFQTPTPSCSCMLHDPACLTSPPCDWPPVSVDRRPSCF